MEIFQNAFIGFYPNSNNDRISCRTLVPEEALIFIYLHQSVCLQIKDLPRNLTLVNSLVDFLTRFLWQISAQHAVVNYPNAEYGALALNAPAKLYHDSRVADNVFSLYNFPNANITAVSVSFHTEWGGVGVGRRLLS